MNIDRQTVDHFQKEYQESKIETLKKLGSIQIVLGFLCAVSNLIGIILYERNPYGFFSALFVFEIVCLILSGLKTAFMCMCILGALITGPAVFGMSVIGIMIRIGSDRKTISIIIAITSFVEIIVSIIAASVCCCCSSLDDTKSTNCVYVGNLQSMDGAVLNIPGIHFQRPYIHNIPIVQAEQEQVCQSVMTPQYPVMTQHNGFEMTIVSSEQPPPYKS